MHPPGLQGVDKLTRYIPQLLSPWVAGDYFETYEAASKIIREVDPAIVALDLVYGPAIDATLDEHRAYTIITPNILSDIAPPAQSLWSVLSRYPASVIRTYIMTFASQVHTDYLSLQNGIWPPIPTTLAPNTP